MTPHPVSGAAAATTAAPAGAPRRGRRGREPEATESMAWLPADHRARAAGGAMADLITLAIRGMAAVPADSPPGPGAERTAP